MENRIVKGLRFGKRFILDGKWSDDLPRLFIEEGIEELVVGELRGAVRDSIDFLAQVPWMKSFMLSDLLIKDISGVHFLTELRSLDMSDYSGKPIDFSHFPYLDQCYLEFNKGRASVGRCQSLRDLSLQHYCYRDLSPLTSLSNLTSLWFSQGSLGDVSEIGAFPELRTLSLLLLRNLKDFSPIAGLKELTELNLQCSKGIDKLDSLATMGALRSLNLVDCGDIESLAPLEACPKLESLCFGGDTKILDGDITPVLRIPNLKSVLFANRRSYNLKRQDMPEHLRRG